MSIRRLLLLYVLAHDADGRSTAGGSEVAGQPKHAKKRGQHDSFRYPDPKQVGLDPLNSRLFLPKLGWLRYRNSRTVLGRVNQGWFEFRRQLAYKLGWNGGELILVPPQNTSRRCPECDYVSAENRQTQARFACIACGFEGNADLVGAINILRAGRARCACEVSDR